MPHFDPDPFLTELTKLYESNKEKGSVWVTFKRKEWKPLKEKDDKKADTAADSKKEVSV